MKKISKYVSWILIINIMLILNSRTTLAYSLNEVPEVSYSMEYLNIVEEMKFIDSDGKMVYMKRIIRPDGTATNIIEKNHTTTTSNYKGYSYQTFLEIMKGKVFDNVHGMSLHGSEVTGSQYKHVYISSNSQTIYRKNVNTLSYVITVLLGLKGAAYGTVYSLATKMFNADANVNKWVINESVYEVRRSYDNTYYIHCYHDHVYEYDSGGHQLRSYVDYRQAIGG